MVLGAGRPWRSDAEGVSRRARGAGLEGRQRKCRALATARGRVSPVVSQSYRDSETVAIVSRWWDLAILSRGTRAILSRGLQYYRDGEILRYYRKVSNTIAMVRSRDTIARSPILSRWWDLAILSRGLQYYHDGEISRYYRKVSNTITMVRSRDTIARSPKLSRWWDLAILSRGLQNYHDGETRDTIARSPILSRWWDLAILS